MIEPSVDERPLAVSLYPVSDKSWQRMTRFLSYKVPLLRANMVDLVFCHNRRAVIYPSVLQAFPKFIQPLLENRRVLLLGKRAVATFGHSVDNFTSQHDLYTWLIHENYLIAKIPLPNSDSEFYVNPDNVKFAFEFWHQLYESFGE